MAKKRIRTLKLNCDIDEELKIKLAVYSKQKQLKIWETVEMALTHFLKNENLKEERKNEIVS